MDAKTDGINNSTFADECDIDKSVNNSEPKTITKNMVEQS